MENSRTYKPEKASFKDYLRIFKGIKLPWLFIILIFAATIATTVISLFVTYFTGDAVDASGDVPAGQLVSFALGYIALAAASAGTSIFSGVASERINLGLRKKLWSRIIYTKQSCYDKDGGESLVSRVTTDCDYASKLLTVIVSLCSVIVSLAIYIRQMYALNLKLANYIMILVPFSILIGWVYAKLKFLIAQKTQAMLSRSTTYLVERTNSLSFIKTSGTKEEEIQLGKENFRNQYSMQIKTGLMNALYTSLQTLYNIVSILIPFVVGAGLVSAGILTAGEVVTFYGISGTVGVYFTNVIDEVGTIRQANGALARVIKTLSLPFENVDEGISMDEPDNDILFEDVTFSYGDKNTLRNVTCTVPKHKVTAVIGSNGSGKTTMFRLVERLYEPDSGSIKFGDKDISGFSLNAWRRTFAVVAQDSPLLEGTVRENICYGCERDVSEEELIKAAKQAQIYDYICTLPDGFESKVASGGANFSGGQRQCLAIARAIMNSPDYLLLDEVTSSLDAKSEKAVMEALEELMKDRTTIVIAHSLSAIKNADYVIVLKDGCVESCGTPESILEMTDNYLSKIMNRKHN